MQQPRDKAKRWLARLGSGVIILCLAVGGFWYWINIPPQIDVPNPELPNPNGYDYFLRAGAAFVKDRKGVDEITSSTVKSTYPLSAKEAWLQQNAKAIQLLREGLKYSSAVPHNASSSQYSQFRSLTRALAVESHVRAARGDWSGAADSALDGVEFGDDVARGGPLIAGLVSKAVQAISLREMYRITPHLNAREAKLAARRMEHLYAGRFPYFKTLQEEKWAQQSALMKMMGEHSWRWKQVRAISEAPLWVTGLIRMVNRSDSPPTPSRLDIVKEYLKNSTLFFISKRRILNDYSKGMDVYIANGRAPYKMQPVAISGNRFTNMLLSVYEDTRWNWARMDAYSVLDMTMLALRAYRLEKGYYPVNLKELVPEYLTKIPADPFIGDAPLHYQLQGNKYCLWSVGPDGIDNHAAPIINSDNYSASAKYRLLDPDSKGDVVAGINMP